MSEEFKACKPCPLCETNPLIGGGMIVHPVCDCFGDNVYIEWDKWNNRPIEDELQERIAELEAENERLKDIEEKALEQSQDVQMNWLSPFEAEGLKQRIAELEAENKSQQEKIVHWQGFARECQQAAKELEAERQWISVDERLPEIGEFVFVYGKQNTIYDPYPIVFLDIHYIDGKFWMRVAREVEFQLNYFTHWQPLPAPPEVE